MPGGEAISGRAFLEENIVDFLTNLAHLCDRENLVLASALKSAGIHYEAETEGGEQFEAVELVLESDRSVELKDGNLARWETRREPRSLEQVRTLVCWDCGEELEGLESTCDCHDESEASHG